MVNSIAAVERAWRLWAVEHGLDPDYVAPRIHGRRAVDSIAALGPDLDQAMAFKRLEYLEATDTDGVIATSGIHKFLASLSGIPWGIVTSGTKAIAIPRLRAGGIEVPDVFVTAEMISDGKPHPAPFLEGASRLGVAPEKVLAFEDTGAGVQSALAAGMQVIGVTDEAGLVAHAKVGDFTELQVKIDGVEALIRLEQM